MNKRIILASGSKQRKMIMDSLGVDYEVRVANVDERSIRDVNLLVRAEKIAKLKADKILENGIDGIVIAADTFVECNGEILEKPVDLVEARDMLKMESGNKMIVYTGFCYIDTNKKLNFLKTSVSKVWFRELSDGEIDNFVKNNPVTTWAGAFSLMFLYQTSFVRKISGSMTAVYGLPTEFLVDCLEKSGVEIKGKR